MLPNTENRAVISSCCGLCGKLTIMVGTQRCDSCWELERRIKANPDLARKILDSL